jgi:hypothetical protein
MNEEGEIHEAVENIDFLMTAFALKKILHH